MVLIRKPIYNISGDIIGDASYNETNSIIGFSCKLPLYEINDCKSLFDITKKPIMPASLQKQFKYPTEKFTVHNNYDTILCEIIVPRSKNTSNPIMINDLTIGKCDITDDRENINVICFSRANNCNICIKNNKDEIVAKTFGFTFDDTSIKLIITIILMPILILVFILSFILP